MLCVQGKPDLLFDEATGSLAARQRPVGTAPDPEGAALNDDLRILQPLTDWLARPNIRANEGKDLRPRGVNLTERDTNGRRMR